MKVTKKEMVGIISHWFQLSEVSSENAEKGKETALRQNNTPYAMAYDRVINIEIAKRECYQDFIDLLDQK